METIQKNIKIKDKWWEYYDLIDYFAKNIDTKLFWACNDCWSSPCECWHENY